MKKTYRSLIAIILAVTMIFAANSTIPSLMNPLMVPNGLSASARKALFPIISLTEQRHTIPEVISPRR